MEEASGGADGPPKAPTLDRSAQGSDEFQEDEGILRPKPMRWRHRIDASAIDLERLQHADKPTGFEVTAHIAEIKSAYAQTG
ncbi:MAG: hypothetical protein WCP77_22160 [Roseococcus sp.]